MVLHQSQDAKAGRRRISAAAVVALLAAACSGGDAEPVDLGPPISAKPSVATAR